MHPAQALGLSDKSVKRILRYDLHYHFYTLQVTFQINGKDKIFKLNFANQIIEEMNKNVELFQYWFVLEVCISIYKIITTGFLLIFDCY